MMEEEPTPPTWCFQRKASIENSDQVVTRDRLSSYGSHRQFGSRAFERGAGSQIDTLIEQIDNHNSTKILEEKEEKIPENNLIENKNGTPIAKSSIPYQPPPPPKKGSRFIANPNPRNNSLPPVLPSTLQPPPQLVRKSTEPLGTIFPMDQPPPLLHTKSVPLLSPSSNRSSTNENQSQTQEQSISETATSTVVKDLRTVVADREYVAVDPGELTIKVGDTISILQCPDNGWCQGEVNNETGWFPINVSDVLLEAQEGLVDKRSILLQKDRTLLVLDRKIGKRPTKNELIKRSIVPDQVDAVQDGNKEVETKQRADILAMLLDTRKCADNDESEMSTRDGTTDTTDFSDTTEDDESVSLEDQAIILFATKPERAINMLINNKIINGDAASIAKYLYTNKRLKGQMIGDYLGDRGEINKEVLNSFLGLMDFSGLEFVLALRQFLFVFRLPVESQKIDRIMEAFAAKYYTSYTGTIFNSQDCVHTLAFSTLMLNTDLHSPQVKKKMTQQEFVNLHKGINDGQNLSQVYLEDVYQRILEEEIKTKDDNNFPKAAKRGFLFIEKKSTLRSKKFKKYWWILDPPSFNLYCFKSEMSTKPIVVYAFQDLKVKERQTPTVVKGKLPLVLTYKKGKKITEVRIFAGSKRLWVDWLTIFSEYFK